MSSAREKSLPRLTNTQAVQFEQVLALLEERLRDIGILIRVRCGDESQPAISAGENCRRVPTAEVGIGKNGTAEREVGST